MPYLRHYWLILSVCKLSRHYTSCQSLDLLLFNKRVKITHFPKICLPWCIFKTIGLYIIKIWIIIYLHTCSYVTHYNILMYTHSIAHHIDLQYIATRLIFIKAQNRNQHKGSRRPKNGTLRDILYILLPKYRVLLVYSHSRQINIHKHLVAHFFVMAYARLAQSTCINPHRLPLPFAHVDILA